MKKQGYNFTLEEGLCFGRGPRVPPRPAYVPKGKPDNYYGYGRGLGFVSSSDDECCQQVIDQLANLNGGGYSSDSSGQDSDVSLGKMFKGLISNMATINLATMEEDDQLPTWVDPQIHHLNIYYGDQFKQREPPIEDKVVQVNMDDSANPKPIFISERS